MVRTSAFLALRQLVHRGPSSIGGLAGVLVAVVLIFMQLGFRNAFFDSAINIPRALDADIFITSPLYESMITTPPWVSKHALMSARAIHGVQDVRPLYSSVARLRSPKDGANMSGWIFAFDLNKPVFLLPELNANSDLLRLPDSALLDRESRFHFRYLVERVEAGDPPTVAYNSPGLTLARNLTMQGLFSLGPTFTLDGIAVTSDLNFFRLMNIPLDRISLGLVKVEPGQDSAQVAQALRANLGAEAKVFVRDEFLAKEVNHYAKRTPIGMIFNFGLLVGAVVGVVFISQVLHGVIDANLKEYAVLVAMGYPGSFFKWIVFEIAGAIAVLTFVPSLIIAAILYSIAGSATHLPMVMHAATVAAVFLLVLVMGSAAAMFAIRRLRNADPLDLFV